MSYIINRTDGTTLTEIVDGDIDQRTTDLTLIGKNSSTYGVFINENFVRLLENFANVSNPNNPILGQLWYDTGEGRLKVYDGAGFKVTSGTIVANTVPDSLGQGDIWIDSKRRQLYFHDGTGLVLSGPIYTEDQGVTGFSVSEVIDIDNKSHTVIFLYVAQVLIGIYSKDQFRPRTRIDGYDDPTSTTAPPRDVNIGFNAGNYAGIKYDTVATKAESLVDEFNNVYQIEDFILASSETITMSGTVFISAEESLVLGPLQSNKITSTEELFEISSLNVNQNVKILTTQYGNGPFTNIFIDAANQYVGINTDTPLTAFDVNGDTVIRGNLTVEGTTISINSSTLEIEDKNIVLGKGETITDSTADGGGITLLGSNEKTFNWVQSTSAWTSSEHMNLVFTKAYHIAGVKLLDQTSIGPTITDATGLVRIGQLEELKVDSIRIDGDTISSISSYENRDIILEPRGTLGTVNVSGKKITNVADTDLLSITTGNDAVNVNILKLKVESIPLGFAYEITGVINPNSYIASTVLKNVYPVSEHRNGTTCRVFCTDKTTPIPSVIVKVFIITSTSTRQWEWSSDVVVTP